MAKVPIRCPQCKREGQLEEAHLGQGVRCKHCQAKFRASRIDNTPETPPIGGASTLDAESWQVGRVILDDYEIIKELGRGGMGKVHLVKSRTTGREFAVKT